MSDYIRKLDTLSYSRLSVFNSCEHAYDMKYNGLLNENNEIEFPEYKTSNSLSFGQLVHRGVEYSLQNNKILEFENVLELLNKDERAIMDNADCKKIYNTDIIKVIEEIHNYTNKNNLKYLSHEHKLDVELKPEMFDGDIDLSLYKKFGGDIDIVFKDTSNEHIFLADIKTASWFYEKKLKTDSFTQYQLALYKYFYSVQENIPTSDIEQGFFIVKKNNKKELFESFKFTAGDKKIKNSLELMRKMINKSTVKKIPFIQNRKNCANCDLKDTKFCKGSNAMKMYLNNN